MTTFAMQDIFAEQVRAHERQADHSGLLEGAVHRHAAGAWARAARRFAAACTHRGNDDARVLAQEVLEQAADAQQIAGAGLDGTLEQYPYTFTSQRLSAAAAALCAGHLPPADVHLDDLAVVPLAVLRALTDVVASAVASGVADEVARVTLRQVNAAVGSP